MKKEIKKYFVIMLVVSFTVSIATVGVGCKGEPVEEVTEEATEEIVEEEVEEVIEETGITVPENDVTLEWSVQDSENGIKLREEFVEIFEEKYPTIHIELIPIPYDDMNAKMLTSVIQGNESDIMDIYTDWLIGLDTAKLFAPITPNIYTKEELTKYQPANMLGFMSGADGEEYTIVGSNGGVSTGIIVNCDMLDEAGIDMSTLTNWKTVMDAAKKLTVYKDDGTILVNGLVVKKNYTFFNLLDFILMQGGHEALFNPETGEWNFNTPEAKNALELLYSPVEENVWEPTSAPLLELFPLEQAAMGIVGSWSVGYIGKNYPDLNLDYVIMPVISGGERVHVMNGGWTAIGLSKNNFENDINKYNASALFIKELLESTTYYDINFENEYWSGIFVRTLSLDKLEERTKSGEANKSEIISNLVRDVSKNMIPINSLLNFTNVGNQVVDPKIMEVWTGVTTIDEALAYLTETLNSLEAEKRS